MIITIRYSCFKCGLNRVELQVPARGDEGILAWIEQMARLISRNHDERSPDCHIETLSELLIPMTGTDKVGGVTLQ